MILSFSPSGAGKLPGLPLDTLFSISLDYLVCLVFVAAKHQPAWAFGNIKAKYQYRGAETAADPECISPAMAADKPMAMKQEHRCERTERRAHPKGSIDYQVYRAAHLPGNQFVHRRVDGGVLSADPTAGKEAENGETQKFQENALAMVASE